MCALGSQHGGYEHQYCEVPERVGEEKPLRPAILPPLPEPRPAPLEAASMDVEVGLAIVVVALVFLGP